jgi:putative heme iron utilization protein
MPTYRIHYSTETSDESELTLTTEAPATKIQIVEAAAKDAVPNEFQEIGDVSEIVADAEAEIEDQGTFSQSRYHDIMAEWSIMTLWYTVDDNPDPVHL